MNTIAAITVSVVLMWIAILIAIPMALWKWLQTSEDEPGRLMLKWLVTAIGIGLSVLVFAKLGPLHGLSMVLVACLVIGIMWAPNMGNTLAGWLGGFYTGDGGPEELKPIYSYATAKLNRGDVAGAVAEIRAQLMRFPGDFQGSMMLARVWVERQNNLEGAAEILEQLGSQEGLSPSEQAAALVQLADWRLKYGLDPAGADEALEQVERRFAGTEAGFMAAQKRAHLASKETVEARQHTAPVAVVKGPTKLGLNPDQAQEVPQVVEDPAETAKRLVAHLTEHPQDFESRSRLADLYAVHYGRPEMGIDQLEQLVALPAQPQKNVVLSLNKIADIQVERMGDAEGARATLRRIAELFPGSAAAETATARAQLLGLETRGRKAGGVVKLGSYANNLGLQGERWRPPT